MLCSDASYFIFLGLVIAQFTTCSLRSFHLILCTFFVLMVFSHGKVQCSMQLGQWGSHALQYWIQEGASVRWHGLCWRCHGRNWITGIHMCLVHIDRLWTMLWDISQLQLYPLLPPQVQTNSQCKTCSPILQQIVMRLQSMGFLLAYTTFPDPLAALFASIVL